MTKSGEPFKVGDRVISSTPPTITGTVAVVYTKRILLKDMRGETLSQGQLPIYESENFRKLGAFAHSKEGPNRTHLG